MPDIESTRDCARRAGGDGAPGAAGADAAGEATGSSGRPEPEGASAEGIPAEVPPDERWRRIRMGRRNLPASAPRVLVADPDPEARLRVQQALCRTCLVDVAGTAADARRLVAEGDYDGLVIDVEAVEADLDVLARFRSGDGSGGKGGPAVALAGGSPTEARERLLEAGYDACMTGSLDARRLQALMRDAGTRDAGTRDAGTRDAGPDSGARARVHDTERPNALRSARREA